MGVLRILIFLPQHHTYTDVSRRCLDYSYQFQNHVITKKAFAKLIRKDLGKIFPSASNQNQDQSQSCDILRDTYMEKLKRHALKDVSCLVSGETSEGEEGGKRRRAREREKRGRGETDILARTRQTCLLTIAFLFQETLCCVLLFPSPYESVDLLPNQKGNQQQPIMVPVEPDKDATNVAVVELVLRVLEENPSCW